MLYCISTWSRGHGEVYIVPAESQEEAAKKLAEHLERPEWWFQRNDAMRIDNLTEVTLVYEQGEEED